MPDTLIEIWQANAAGRYVHGADQHDAPLDPNFFGGGRCVTDDEGRYRFITIKPGAYPWRNHHNAWRPNHIHLSLFGPSFVTRLVTQMYFPGDPLLAFDPIYQSTPERARERLISRFSLDFTEPEWALGYEFDIVLRGPRRDPVETLTPWARQTPSQTVGPFFAYGLTPEQYGYAYRSIGTAVIANETPRRAHRDRRPGARRRRASRFPTP